MGKRKHLQSQLTLCDYTSYPISQTQPKRYLPIVKNEKVIKCGSYITWEAAASHAAYMKSQNQMPACVDKWQPQKSMELLNEAAGRQVLAGPDYTQLNHFKENGDSLSDYLCQCDRTRGPLKVVSILTVQDTCMAQQYILSPEKNGDFSTAISTFFQNQPYNVIKPTKKIKGLPKNKELTVLTLVDNQEPLNKKAKQLFRMNLFGPILLVCIDKEQAGNYLDFTFDEYKKAFDPEKQTKKQKLMGESSINLDGASFDTVAKSLKSEFDRVSNDAAAKSISKKPPAASTVNKQIGA